MFSEKQYEISNERQKWKKSYEQSLFNLHPFFKILKTASKRRRRNTGKMMLVKAVVLKASFPLRSCRGWSSHMATGVCGSVLNKP